MSDAQKITIVIPVYNEEYNIEEVYKRTFSVMDRLNSDFEFIFIDDGSKDNTFTVICELSKNDDRVKGISLSRNFGHQVALQAGLEAASGDLVITMDGDLQHPPELIIQMIEKYRQGFDIVNTRRLETADAGITKKTSAGIFYKLINALSDIHIESGSADFRLMSRKALEAFLRFPERNRFTRGLISWMGFRQAIIDYSAPSRFTGKTKYNYRKMFRLALDGITSFSSRPLRISFYCGFIVFILGLIYAIFAVIKYINGETVQGWTSTLVSILILGGIQLLTIGIIGEYIARIFNESKARPLYFIKDKTGNIK